MILGYVYSVYIIYIYDIYILYKHVIFHLLVPKAMFLNRESLAIVQKFQALEVFLDLMDLPKFRQEMVKWGSGGSVNRIFWRYFC